MQCATLLRERAPSTKFHCQPEEYSIHRADYLMRLRACGVVPIVGNFDLCNTCANTMWKQLLRFLCDFLLAKTYGYNTNSTSRGVPHHLVNLQMSKADTLAPVEDSMQGVEATSDGQYLLTFPTRI